MPNTTLLKESLSNAGFPADALDKVETLFVASLKEATDSAVAAAVNRLETQHAEKLVEAKTQLVESETERVSTFLDKALTEWAKDNADKLDGAIKTRLVESFFGHIKGALGAAGVIMTDKSTKALNESTANGEIESLSKRLSEAEEAIRDKDEKLAEAEDKLAAIERADVLAEETEGLSDVLSDKVATLSEAFAHCDTAGFRARVKTLVEAFGNKPKSDEDGDDKGDKDDKGVDTKTKDADADKGDDGKGQGDKPDNTDNKGKLNESVHSMNSYLSAIRGEPLKG